MKKSLVLAMAMALGVTASAYAANPFSDVPAGHWAYDSVAKLAAAGVVDGYVDGAFGGDKLMTRYEMAQIVAKAMAKGANVDKLAAEFADELDTLGVRVAKLEKGADAVKITGEIRYSYADYDKDGATTNDNKLRSRIWLNGAINDDWSYTGMLESTEDFGDNNQEESVSYQRAYVNGKLGGMKVQAGRYHLALGDKNVYDTRFDGVQIKYGKDVALTAGYGKADPSSVARASSDETLYAELGGKVGVVGLTAGYYAFDNVVVGTAKTNEDDDIWALNATLPVAKDLKLSAIYLKADDMNTKLDDDGYVATLQYKGAKAAKPGSWGVTAKWYDMGATTYIDHTMNGKADDMLGFEGYSLFVDYAVAKNIVAKVEWYDLEDKETEVDTETLWAQVVFTF